MQKARHVSNYQKDFYQWAKTQASLLKRGDFSNADLEHIIEEIETLGRSERRELKSHMIKLLHHLLKIEYQPKKHTKSWDRTVKNARKEISLILDDSPSLRRELKKVMEEAYPYARKDACEETKLDLKTFPDKSPWNLDEVMGD